MMLPWIIAGVAVVGWVVTAARLSITRTDRDDFADRWSKAEEHRNDLIVQDKDLRVACAKLAVEHEKLKAEYARWTDRDERGRFVKREG